MKLPDTNIKEKAYYFELWVRISYQTITRHSFLSDLEKLWTLFTTGEDYKTGHQLKEIYDKQPDIDYGFHLKTILQTPLPTHQTEKDLAQAGQQRCKARVTPIAVA